MLIGKMQLKAATLLVLVICLQGCAHLSLKATKEQMQPIKKGEVAPFDGFIITKGYLQTVGDIKIDQ